MSKLAPMGRLSAAGMGSGTVLIMTWFTAWLTCRHTQHTQHNTSLDINSINSNCCCTTRVSGLLGRLDQSSSLMRAHNAQRADLVEAVVDLCTQLVLFFPA